MSPEQWQKVDEVLQGALDRAPQERASFLDDACAGDQQLRDETNSLINAYDEAGDFIEQPAIVQDAGVIAGTPFQTNVGSEVGPYRIVDCLGVGGMGEVYLAQDERLNRLVALKLLPAYFASDDERLSRFQREARAASALNHPNILTIHEVGETDGIRFIATEYIDGQTIHELLAQSDLTLDGILDIVTQVAFALAAAHAAGIVHRDIKPENIMRRPDGLVKILDFGIAKLLEPPSVAYQGLAGIPTPTESGAVVGTVGYMSPEQARGLPVDERTDIWSLGVVLYQMLAHRLPFQGATRMDTMVNILEHDPAPLFDLGSAAMLVGLKTIVEKALRKERGERYQTATELLAALRAVRRNLTEEQSGNKFSDLVRSQIGGDHSEPIASGGFIAGADKDVGGPGKLAHRERSNTVIALGLMSMLVVAIAAAMFYRRSVVPSLVNGAQITEENTGKPYGEMNSDEQLAFIDQQEQRVSAMMGDRPVKLNDEALHAIKRYVDRYAARLGSISNEPGSEDLRIIYARPGPYLPLIARSFAARKVPVIIGIYLPMIESEYRPCFENSIGAKGLFQFLPQTAKSYGVAHEDMCDADQMAPAAAHYIADHMAELGEDSESMTLVLVSFNRGATWVRSTLRQLRETNNYERNFWTLFANRDKLDEAFRNETAGYVPMFFAAAIIGENPRNFQLQTAPLSTLTNPTGSK
ncbi:MAG: serine/threonine-protein kinase [bacterium]